MSEHITHLAVAEDSALLAAHDPDYSEHFRYAAKEYPRALQLGSTTRSGDAFIFPLLKKWREDWQNGDDRSEKLAYIIGWAGHLAGDRTFKPVFRITDLAYYVRGFPGPSNASVYQDAATFDKVYHRGKRGPFHPNALAHGLKGHPAAAHLPVAATETAMAYRFADRAAQLRNFSSEGMTDDWPERFDYLSSERQRFYVDLDRYTAAAHHPAPDRQYQYLIEPNFYNPQDPLLQLVETLRAGESSEVDLKDALAAAEEGSLYAQSLALGHQFYRAASDFFEGRISEEEGRVRMRTNTAHKQPLDYYVDRAKQQEND